jgi:hypothetical protein
MGQKSSFQSTRTTTTAGVNMQPTVAYVEEMANELAAMATAVGCRQLFALLTLASIEAKTCVRRASPR